MKIWTCGSSPQSGSWNAWMQIKNVNGASCEQIWNFFCTIQMISCHNWWPRTKSGYITTTRRQSNNQWSDNIAAHPPQKIPSAKIHWKISRLDFLGSRQHPPHWLFSKGPNYQHEVLLISAAANFEGKTPWEGYQGCLVLARQCPVSLVIHRTVRMRCIILSSVTCLHLP